MPRTPIDVFDDQIGDAEHLLGLAREMLRTRDEAAAPAARALLRQAIVATAAAVESYVAVKASTFVRAALKADAMPERLAKLQVPLGDALTASGQTSPRWAFELWACEQLERESSCSPSKIGMVFSAVGKKEVFKAVDKKRGVPAGSSRDQLDELATRRNLIAHRGDRTATGRRKLAPKIVEQHMMNAREIVGALEETL